MNSKIIRLYILVKGKVQGIGYRYFVTELANDMELKGWVRNLVSGNVDIEIQGEEDVVKEFVNKLNSGHPWAKIRNIETNEIPVADNEKHFKVRC